MLTVEKLYRMLSLGELASLDMAVDSSGTIRPEYRNKIIHYTNEALSYLYSRFPLLTESENLILTGSGQTHSFMADATKVVSIQDEWGNSLSFYDRPSPKHIYILNREIHFPKNLKGLVNIEYQFSYRLDIDSSAYLDPAEDDSINIHPVLYPALTGYIASKIYGGMLTNESQIAAQNYWNQFERTIADAQAHGMIPGYEYELQKFERNGWV